MQSRISIPTDNIYKFYATFGLVLLISTMALFVFVYSTFQANSHARYVELKVLASMSELTPEQSARKDILEAKEVIDTSDKKTYMDVIAFLLASSLFLLAFGFNRWHKKIQPLQDEILLKQKEKTELEIKLLNKQINASRIKREK
ncbi:hypothetical protein [Vibrio parahaemolyticus]|uniref:hypothetical protein n=2 Tax=Vibrio parahaemolyticus TaxID=670 RepID=UPI00046FE4B1|nr:hypothetical protein [Vibrio parahaemolyticus]HCE4573022.1 hypothetical protein [Vibrio parahaemolyticus]